MRRTAISILLVAATAVVFTATAAAKELSVSLAGLPPGATGPGEPWAAELLVHGEPQMLAQATPTVTIDDGAGTTRTFTAERTGDRAADGQLIYVARVVFPSEGRWTYTLTDGLSDREYEGGTIQIGSPSEAPVATSHPDEAAAFPAWPAILAVALLVAAAGTALVVRRHRLAS